MLQESIFWVKSEEHGRANWNQHETISTCLQQKSATQTLRLPSVDVATISKEVGAWTESVERNLSPKKNQTGNIRNHPAPAVTKGCLMEVRGAQLLHSLRV